MDDEERKKIREALRTGKTKIRFGKYKWICECGANIWDDDRLTDRKCINCGRDRTFWEPAEHI
jgi:hypothetical protein